MLAYIGSSFVVRLNITPEVSSPIPLNDLLRTSAPPDPELAFAPEPMAGHPAGRWDTILPVWLTGEGQPVVFMANARPDGRPSARGRKSTRLHSTHRPTPIPTSALKHKQ